MHITIDLFMRLWTWQNKGFSIADPEHQVDSSTYSRYLNYPCASERQRFREVYEKFWKLLGTKQFHWYYIHEEDAKNEATILEYTSGEVLWEVDVPEEDVFAFVCSVAWSRLLGRDVIPERLRNRWKREQPWRYEELKGEFEDYWRKQRTEDIWDRLLLDKRAFFSQTANLVFCEVMNVCCQVLLHHPIDESWIRKDPSTTTL